MKLTLFTAIPVLITEKNDYKIIDQRFLRLTLHSAKVIIVPNRIIWSWYTGRWWVVFYIWYSEEGTDRGRSPPRPLLSVPNVITHLSTASVPITVLLYNGPLLCGVNVPIKRLTQLLRLGVQKPPAQFLIKKIRWAFTTSPPGYVMKSKCNPNQCIGSCWAWRQTRTDFFSKLAKFYAHVD